MDLKTIPDLINGLFELCGVCAVLMSVFKLRRDKAVAGVHWAHVAFFTGWGIWNLYYYPFLGQWLSFIAGVGVMLANSWYLFLLWKYRG